MNGLTHAFRSLQVFVAAALLFAVALAPVPTLAQAQDAGTGGGVVALSLAEAERMMLEKNRELQAARRAQESARADSKCA